MAGESGIDRSRLQRGVIAVSGSVHQGTGAVLAASNIPVVADIDLTGGSNTGSAFP